MNVGFRSDFDFVTDLETGVEGLSTALEFVVGVTGLGGVIWMVRQLFLH